MSHFWSLLCPIIFSIIVPFYVPFLVPFHVFLLSTFTSGTTGEEGKPKVILFEGRTPGTIVEPRGKKSSWNYSIVQFHEKL